MDPILYINIGGTLYSCGPEVVQVLGQSAAAVMSQDALTKIFAQNRNDLLNAGVTINVFDGLFKYGYYSSSDASFVDPAGGTNESCSVNSIPCIEGDSIRIHFSSEMPSSRILICSAEGVLLHTQLFLNVQDFTFVAPAGASYFLFNVTTGTGQAAKLVGTTVYRNFVNINDEIQRLNYDISCLITSAKQKTNISRLGAIKGANVLILESIDKDAQISLSGKNILDVSSKVSQTIKNDAGEEVFDYNGLYYSRFVPVTPGESLYINFGVQRVYEFDANKTWLRRTIAYPQFMVFGKYKVPNDCYFIQVQASRYSVNLEQAQIEHSERDTGYEDPDTRTINVTASQTNVLLPAYGQITNIYVGEGVTATFKSNADTLSSGGNDSSAVVIPECSSYALWEPTFTTNDYTVPIGRNNVVLDLKYYDFLEMYFDKYLGDHGDLVFTKHSLGPDSSSFYDVITYDIIPKNYNRTVLISAGMNACELSPMWGLAYLVKAIMEQYDDDAGLKYLRENVRFKIIPVICPWSFDQAPMQYTNSNGVRINKNFNYLNSWTLMKTSDANTRGPLPDSEVETRILKKWINDNANEAALWIDAHCDPDNNTPYLNSVFCSNAELVPICDAVQRAIRDYYVAKGTASPDEPTGSSTARINIYPKTLYSKAICNVKSIMIEQYPVGTAHGGDSTLANDDADIRNYVLMLRAYTLALLERESEAFEIANAGMLNYQTLLEAKKIIQ